MNKDDMVSEKSEIEQLVDDLDRNANSIQHRVNLLSQRVAAICRPLPTEEEAMEKPEILTPLGGDLYSVVVRLERAVDELVELYDSIRL